MGDARGVSSGFYVLVTGQIDGVQMTGYDNLYVKYSFNKGHDWAVLAGVEHGVSQIARRSSGSDSDVLTWNYPLDVMFRSSNVHGWPQVVIGVYGLTVWGSDVVRGYGCVHVPTIPGRYTRYVPLYAPVSSSLCQRLTAWITNNPPEFFDSKFIAQGKGREVTRVRSHGCVKVTFNVTTKNMSEWGYSASAERTGDLLSAQAQLNASFANATAADRPTSAHSARAHQQMQQQLQQMPSKTTLSAATTAGMAAARSNASRNTLINPPSGANSRESSLIRRGGSGGGGGLSSREYDSSLDDEAKYPLSQQQRGASSSSPLLRPMQASAVEMQATGSSSLAPLRTGPRPSF